MSLTKCVNGEHVACSPDEEAAIRAEWAAADAKSAAIAQAAQAAAKLEAVRVEAVDKIIAADPVLSAKLPKGKPSRDSPRSTGTAAGGPVRPGTRWSPNSAPASWQGEPLPVRC